MRINKNLYKIMLCLAIFESCFAMDNQLYIKNNKENNGNKRKFAFDDNGFDDQENQKPNTRKQIKQNPKNPNDEINLLSEKLNFLSLKNDKILKIIQNSQTFNNNDKQDGYFTPEKSNKNNELILYAPSKNNQYLIITPEKSNNNNNNNNNNKLTLFLKLNNNKNNINGGEKPHYQRTLFK